MPDFYYHYTSKAAMRGIKRDDKIKPGGDGFTYLTDMLFSTGAEAADRLAIKDSGKPIEVYCKIPQERLTSLEELPDTEEILDQESGVILKGGARQFRTFEPIHVRGVEWFNLDPPFRPS